MGGSGWAGRATSRGGRAAVFRVPFVPSQKPRTGDSRGRQVLRRKHEDVWRAAAGSGPYRRADRDHARPTARRERETATDRGCHHQWRLPVRFAGAARRASEEPRKALPRPRPGLSELVRRRAESGMPRTARMVRLRGDAGLRAGESPRAGNGKLGITNKPLTLPLRGPFPSPVAGRVRVWGLSSLVQRRTHIERGRAAQIARIYI